MMKIFTINQNYDDFLYLIQETEQDYINTLGKEGERIENWRIPTQVIFKKSKKEMKNKRMDFTASSFFNGILLMQESLAQKMVRDFHFSAELLPIHTPEMPEPFVFVNILGGKKAVIEAFYYTTDELWAAKHMPKTLNKPVFPELQGKYAFDEVILRENALFRDEKYNGFYFCTDIFVSWAEENGVKGLQFEEAGIIK